MGWQELEASIEAAVLHNLADTLAYGPAEDRYELLVEFGLWPEPQIDGLLFDLVYRDAQGEPSRRTVRAVRIESGAYGPALLGWCYLRNAPRRFVLSRIVELIDRRTGEVIADAGAYLYELAPGLSDHHALIDRCGPGFRILLGLAHADRRLDEVELDAIMLFADRLSWRAGEPAPLDYDADRLRRWLSHQSPDPERIGRDLAAVRGDPEMFAAFRLALRALADADGLLHPAEVSFVLDLG